MLKQKHGVNHEIDVRVPSRDMSEEEITEYRLRDNRNHGEFDYDILANNFDIDYLENVGFKGSELVGFDTDEFEDEFFSYDDVFLNRCEHPSRRHNRRNDWLLAIGW